MVHGRSSVRSASPRAVHVNYRTICSLPTRCRRGASAVRAYLRFGQQAQDILPRRALEDVQMRATNSPFTIYVSRFTPDTSPA